MDQERRNRLRRQLARSSRIWHAGRTVGRTIYEGDGPDDLIGVMDSRDLAELVILCYEYAQEQLDNGGLDG